MWEWMFGCFPVLAGRKPPAPPCDSEVAIVKSALRLSQEAQDDYRYLLVPQKEPKPMQKDATKMMTTILKVVVRITKARDESLSTSSESEEADGDDVGLPATPRERTLVLADAAKDAKEASKDAMPRLSLASTSADCEVSSEVEEVGVNFLYFFDVWAGDPTQPLPEIHMFLKVHDFAALRVTCRVLSNAKALVRHCERLLDIERDGVFSACAALYELGTMKDHFGRDVDDELRALKENNPSIKGLLCIQHGIEFCWKADKQSVLRTVRSLRIFSGRAGQPFYARVLVTICANFAFESASKSLRHLFAKDVLEHLRSGDNADRLHACMALQKVKSPSKLGRFSGAMCLELLKLVRHRRVGKMAVRDEVRLEALQAFAHFRPPQADKVFPFLNEKLRRCERPSDELRSKLDCLLAVLDAEIAKPVQEPDSGKDGWCITM